MKSGSVLIGKVILFLCCAYLSGEHGIGYWYVGPVFGMVILVFHVTSVKALVSLRNGLFLIASTLIYALVNHLISSSFLTLTSAAYSRTIVLLGTVLLTLAQGLFLKASWRRVLIAIPGIFLFWSLFGILSNTFGAEETRFETLINGVTFWQGSYLLFMFGRRPPFLK
ncbi:MAG: hypothetical protein HY590_07870 [Candidatus Omnitrophica bacterium]|nr:hypothetical protein [Candidatus Omnitrophota bacterium]